MKQLALSIKRGVVRGWVVTPGLRVTFTHWTPMQHMLVRDVISLLGL